MRIKISVATASFQMDLRMAIQRAMQMGAHGVQFDLRNELFPGAYGESARRQVLHYLAERNLEVASGHFPLRGTLMDPDRLDQRLAAVADAIEFAASLKIRRMTLRPGPLPEADSPEREDLLQALSELAGVGNRQGVTLCLMPSGDSGEALLRLLEDVKTGPVAVDADLADWVLNNQSYVQEMRTLFRFIGHIEARDAARGLGGKGREVPIGRGEIEWDEVAALLGEMDYTGWINVQRTEGNDRLGDIARGVQYLWNLFSGGME
ncbi:sugar phosphate isomerase/epimerase family protein [Planctomicrobium piriforme]|uniref:Sugar phosphate isomerase/epimerase n=1 Tax=Planctomicrobium piriforme TaxID=1576369 RepID=A0A1I3DMQ2_9PLAN|nr:sugar phosphate isomerase/epimerase family protein [Planctomicrobium piriforme]SFH87859.1 Sugar phosphate isomerase/epimerase [Planctomicrobium piriforme]